MRRGALGMATAALSTLLVASGLTASPAAAGTTYTMPASGPVTLTGHGYGHGHGLSQYGAYGAALAGKTWQEITAFYYPGTSQAKVSRWVRVHISADTSPDVVVATGNKTGVDYRLGGVWKRWWTFSADGAFYAGGQPLRLYYAGTSHLFRGRLTAARPSATSTDRDTVNRLNLENYLRGVVPAEMPTSWEPDAVASQAVAARSYAAWDLSTPSSTVTHYDICDTTSCQVYGGYDREATGGNAAIDATRGIILTHNGTPAFTQFSSSSGGWTSAGSVPYLPAKQDPYDGWKRADGSYVNPNHKWSVAIDVARLESTWKIGDLASIEVLSRDGNGDWGGRIQKLRLIGRGGKIVTVYGSDFRMKLGLKSTYFTFAGVPTKTT